MFLVSSTWVVVNRHILFAFGRLSTKKAVCRIKSLSLISSKTFSLQTAKSRLKMDTEKKNYILPNDQPIVQLECSSAFNALTPKEKLYAHYLSQASWYGGLIVLFQTSPESPLIFSLLHQIFAEESVPELKSKVLNVGVTEDEFTAFLVYACGIYSNSGNYKGFGDAKIVPNIENDVFEKIVKTSKAYLENTNVQSIWEKCKIPIFSLDERHKSLGMKGKGITTYFSLNCTEKDAELVSQWLKRKQIEIYNARTFKYSENGKTVFDVRFAAAEKGFDPNVSVKDEEWEGCIFRVTRGDYSPLLALVSKHLADASQYAANETECNMLDCYIRSFQTGSLAQHKDGSRHWVKDKGPIIETYIGFIETYRDPTGVRGEFEGFVAMVNKEMSKKFSTLVNSSMTLLSELPWPREFEKDKFLQPDFTSLDVLAFAGSGIPSGINIPNYDEIRQSEGFKNVSLGNVIPASYQNVKIPFLSEADKELLDKYRIASFEVQVGLHELLGHGSGKLFKCEKDGTFNFEKEKLIDPLTSDKIKSWYEAGDTYDTKFGAISSAYEECRAEAVGLYLSLDKSVLKVFGFEGEEADNVIYVNWLSLLWNGVAKSLEMYQPTTKSWLQAHAQARYVLMRVCLEAGNDFLKVSECEGGDSIHMSLDKSKLRTVGKKAIGDFLLKLQVYKSTGNIVAAKEMFDKYSDVPESEPHPWARWRDIILLHKQPRKIFVQANTVLQDDSVMLKTYEANFEGLISSWKDRFSSTDNIHQILYELWEENDKLLNAE